MTRYQHLRRIQAILLAGLLVSFPVAAAVQQKYVASDAQAGDVFGNSVAISGDWMAVGAPLADGGPNGALAEAGAVYLFKRDGPGWKEAQVLYATTPAADARFGNDVALSESSVGPILVVGSYLDPQAGNAAGAAYVFHYGILCDWDDDGVNESECWAEKAKLIGTGVATDDRFGFAVDVDKEAIVVGAYQDEPTGGPFVRLNTGAAYIYRCVEYLFDGSGYCSAWDEEKQLLPASLASFNQFGFSVSISGDVVAVGAVLDDDAGADAGATYVYRYLQTGNTGFPFFDPIFDWVFEQKITAEATAGSTFGIVDLSGDGLVVGALNAGAVQSGSAFVYEWDGASTWNLVDTLLPKQADNTTSDAGAGDQFGLSVAIKTGAAAGTGDTILVGARRNNDDGDDSGSVYRYRKVGSSWEQVSKLTASDATGGDQFGHAVALDGETAVVGANLDNGPLRALIDTGSVYTYDERYAVIIEGALSSPGSPDELGADKTARRVYQSLLGRGFTDDRIFYFSQDDQRAGVDALSTVANLDQHLISTAAGDGIDSLLEKATSIPGIIHLFLVGPGNSAGSFFLNPTNGPGGGAEPLGAARIDSWLDTLEADSDIAAIPRTVIIASPHSGTMIAGLSDASNPSGRIIITSSAPDGSAVKGPEEQDGVAASSFFMEELLFEWERGIDLRQSFLTARDKTREISRKDDSSLTAALQYVDNHLQRPQLDDNGDGVGTHNLQSTAVISTPPVDGVQAQSVYLKPDGEGAALPFVVSPTRSLAGPASVCLSALIGNSTTASIAIRSPGVSLPASGSDIQVDLPFVRMNMAPSPIAPSYIVCPGFSTPGKHEVWYWGETTGSSKTTPTKRSVVYVDSPENQAPVFNGTPELLLPTADGALFTNNPVFDWQSGTDPDGDAVTYTLLISNSNAVDADNVLQTSFFHVEELKASSFILDFFSIFGGGGGNISYWQVLIVDPFGKFTASPVNAYSIFTPQFGNRAMGGIVTTGGTVGLEGATVVWRPDDSDLGGQIEALPSDPSGAFLFPDGVPTLEGQSARGQLQAIKMNFSADEQVIECNDCESQVVDMVLLDTDSDGDGIYDISDNCTYAMNATQIDTDGDGHGNACDGDFQNNCLTNIFDLFDFKGNFSGTDEEYDLNSTGGPVQVNIFDLFVFKSLFGSAPGPSAAGLCP